MTRRLTGPVLSLSIFLAIGAVVILYSFASGSILGDRQTVWPPPLTLISTVRRNTTILFTIQNNATYPIIGNISYTVSAPDSQVPIYKAAPIMFGPIAPRKITTIETELPSTFPLDAVISAQVHEEIKYQEPTTHTPTDEASPAAADNGQEELFGVNLKFRSSNSKNSTLDLSFKLRNPSNDVAKYRYVIQIAPTTTGQSTHVPSVYWSEFQYITLSAGEVQDIQFEQQIVLAIGQYTCSLWLQAADEDGVYEQVSQWTYAGLLRVEN